MNPEGCADCPPDCVCAWSCEQGWNEVEIAIHKLISVDEKIFTGDPFIQQALLDVFNG